MIVQADDPNYPDHFRMSPSSMKRILLCPGSARDDIPYETNAKAEAGDVAHEIADQYLKYTGHKDKAVLEDDIYQLIVELVDHDTADAIAKAAAKYVECVESYITEQSQVYFEVKIVHDSIPDFGGTIDTLIYTPGSAFELTIIDLKTGTYKVPAKKNDQLRSYATLARQEFPTDKPVKAIIVQDRVYAKPKVAEFTPQQLDTFEESVRQAEVSDKREAGNHCYFCPVKRLHDVVCEPYRMKFGEPD